MSGRKRLWIILAIGVFGLSIFFLSTHTARGWIDRLSGSVFFSILEPVQSASMKLRNTFDGIIAGPRYRREAKTLQDKIDQLTYDLAQAKAISAENSELRAMLEFTKEQGLPKAFAKVFRTGSMFASDFLINRGSADGLQIGDFVVNQSGQLVGRVEEIRETTAKVLVITDPRFRMIAQVQTDSQSQGLIEGSYGTSIRLRSLPQGKTIRAGDIIVGSPSTTLAALAFPIGTIRRVETSTRDLFQEAIVEPFARLNDVDLVMIYEAARK